MNIKALVVDDHDEIRDLFVMFFKMKGIESESINNPTCALKAFKDGQFDFIVTDLEMHLDSNAGYKFIQEIRKLDTSIPIIMVTGKIFEDARALGLEYGANHVLHKPVDLGELIAIIEMEMAEVVAIKKAKAKAENLV